jgi:hypothetical protein
LSEKPEIVRKPIRRQSAEHYLLITLLSFAASVAGTRLFLEVTGYPQIGNSTLHIAHVLWGGLLLFGGAILPLILANRWALRLSALLTGLGVGLFIDEVGKFITQTNDYFYPAAAPIIYTFFLLTVLLFVRVRRPRDESIRSNLYAVLQDLEEVLDRDLSQEEFNRIHLRLEQVIAENHGEDRWHLADHLLRFMNSGEILIREDDPNIWSRSWHRFRHFERERVGRQRFRAGLIGGLLAWGVPGPLHFRSMSCPRSGIWKGLLCWWTASPPTAWISARRHHLVWGARGHGGRAGLHRSGGCRAAAGGARAARH